MTTIRLLIAYSQELVAGLLAEALHARGFDAETASLESPDQILRAMRRFEPAAVLVEAGPGRDPSLVRLIARLQQAGRSVVVLSDTTEALSLAEYVDAGAAGIVTKTVPIDRVVHVVTALVAHGSGVPPDQRHALQQVLHEHRERTAPFQDLTLRESQILAELMDGRDARTIASESFTSVGTVRGHIEGILFKLGVNSQVAAVAEARAVGWELRQAVGDHGT